MSKKVDYESECLLFLRLKVSGERLTQPGFCSRRSKEIGVKLSLSTFKHRLQAIRAKEDLPGKIIDAAASTHTVDTSKPMARRDYKQLRLEFLAGPWRTLAEFAREKDIKPSAGHFRARTKGWIQEKKLLGRKTDEAAAHALAAEHVGRKVRNVYEQVREMEWKLMGAVKKITDGIANWRPVDSVHAAYTAALAIKELNAALKDMAPFLQGLENHERVNQVFDAYQKGEIDITCAVVDLMKIGVEVPKSMQIMLARGIGDEPPPDDGELISPERIMERRRELIKEIETQRIEFVATRTREVRQIKEELAGKGSFDQQATEEGRDI